MSQTDRHVRVEEIDWAALFPFTHLLRSFRMAIHPMKLFLALLMVVLLWLGGHILDLLSGPRVYPGEYVQYVMSPSTARFDVWLAEQERVSAGIEDNWGLTGVFQTALGAELDAFERFVVAVTRLNFGLDQLTGQGSLDRSTVVGALYELTVALPGWLYHAHCGFLFFYGVLGLLVWSVGGAMLARICALEATRDIPADWVESYRYARSNWVSFLGVLIGPAVIAVLIGLALIVGGLVFFNLPVLDIVGGGLFVIALAGGALISLILVLYLAAVHLFYPAMTVEGPDLFDAISRSFNYVIGKPWRWLFYNVIALLYGAVTYLFVGTVVFLTLWVTHRFVGIGVLRDLESGVGRFDAILPPPKLGQLTYEGQPSQLSLPGKIAMALVWVWRYLTIGVVAAYAVSFYFCANTWIYLLLRRSADGAEFDEVYLEEPDRGGSSISVSDDDSADAPPSDPVSDENAQESEDSSSQSNETADPRDDHDSQADAEDDTKAGAS